LARLREPIEFNAIDGQLDLVCLLLLPTGPEGGQLNSIASVARRLRNPDVLRELRRAPNRAVLYNVVMGKATVEMKRNEPVMKSTSNHYEIPIPQARSPSRFLGARRTLDVGSVLI
jgi:hypothetical protein